MKQRHMLSLLQTGYTTVHVALQSTVATAPKAPGRPEPRVQPGVPVAPWGESPRPWDPIAPRVPTQVFKTRVKLVPGDTVVVENNGGLELATVHVVDSHPRIDVDADFDYKWIVQKVDMQTYESLLAEEKQFMDTLQEIERQKQRDELMANMSAHLPVGTQARAMFDAAIAQYSGQAALGHQAPAQAPIGTQPEQAPAPQMQAPYAPADPASRQQDDWTPGVACK